MALVSTAVTSPHRAADSTGPTSMGERRSRTLRRVPSTQATSPSPRAMSRCRSSVRWVAALMARVLRAPLVRAGSAASASRDPCRSAPADGVGHPPGDVGGAAEQLGQLAVVDRRLGVVVQDPGPHPVGQQHADLVAHGEQRGHSVLLGLVVAHQGAGRRAPGRGSGRG